MLSFSVILSNMGNRCCLPSPPWRGPRLQVESAEPPIGRKRPEPLEGCQAPVAPMGAGGVVERVEAPVSLDQLREGATAVGPVELLRVDPVAPLDLPVQVRAPWPDAAVRDPGRLTGAGEGVEPHPRRF